MSAETDRRLPWPHPARTLVALCATLLLTGVAACSGDPVPAATTTPAATSAQPSPSTTTPSTTTSEPPPPPAAPALQPLGAGTVLAVKVDNTSGSRPRVGVDQAAVVYVEPVEGGLTRLLAVFTSATGGLPPEVGPIRSARESDTALLANYGRVALAFSGASAYTRAIVDQANLASIPSDAPGPGYRRAGDRTAPYNVIGNVQTLLARADTGTTNGDPGFRFGPTSPGGTPANTVSTSWSGSRMSLTWNAGVGQYLVTTDGVPDVDADGAWHGAGTVIVQEVPSQLSPNRDVNGVQTPVVGVVGQAGATYLRGGLAWKGEWSRPDLASPTSFTSGGQRVAMAGPVWVLLVPYGQQVSIG